MQSKDRSIEVHYANVQRQSGISDCGIFAIAFATSVCLGGRSCKSNIQAGGNEVASNLLYRGGKVGQLSEILQAQTPETSEERNTCHLL